MKQEPQKLTLEEYENKYNEKGNVKAARAFLTVAAATIALIMILCLFMMVLKVYELFDKNVYVAIAAGVVALAIFIVFYIVPLTKILKLERFEVRVNRSNLAAAKKHNKAVRRNLATKMIEVHENVYECKWYDDKSIEVLKGALATKDENLLKETLSKIYDKPIKKTVRGMITKESIKCGALTAVSQDNKVDTAIVIAINLKLIKDITYLYGFRPSDTKMMKIFVAVLRNSLIAFGAGGLKVGSGVVGNVTKGVLHDIPILGSLVGTAIDSTANGLINATMTAVLGYQTISYLNKEYKLQDMLDGVEIEEESAFKEVTKEIKEGMLKLGEKKPA